MYGKTFILITIALLLALEVNAEMVKKADLAGTWYPYTKSELSSVLDGYLSQARVGPINGDVKAIVVPHAGLIYSGPIAAYSYRAIQEKKYTTVLLLGFCHRKYFDGISVYKEGYFETPLGLLEVDSQLASEIISHNKKIVFYPEAFKDENSIELELPFIKKVLPNSKIVPIVFGTSNFSYCQMLADVLAEVLSKREDILLVVSTDMSHFHPYDEAKRIDLASIELLKNFRATEIYEKSTNGEQLFCGYMPITTVLLACEKIGIDKIVILKYANSGDVTGDKKRVVGYVSVAIYKAKSQTANRKLLQPEANPPLAETVNRKPLQPEADPPSAETTNRNKEAKMLNDVQRKRLLEIARDTIKTYLETGKVLKIKEDDPLFNKEMGAFVTLHKKGELRGCIGNIVGRGPLYLTVRDMAIESATGDPRFPPVTLDELKDIDIEISVLSELEKVTDVEEIEMGVHGVLIRKGFASGVFLPQVATETGWSREEFLTNLCVHKAGLLPDAWKRGEVDIYIFTAEVFGEKDFTKK